MKREGLLKVMQLLVGNIVFDLRGFPAAAVAVEIAQQLIGPDCASHQLAVEVHKVQEWHRVLASQHRADRGTAASHVEAAVDTAAAGLMVHNLAAAGLCRSFRHPQSCLAREKVLKGKVRRIDEGVADYIRQDSAGCMPLIAGLPASDHNI